MKKEAVIAIIIGISLGAVITYGAHTARQSLQQTTANSPIDDTNNQQQQTSHQITIVQPQTDQVLPKPEAEITGSTTPLSLMSFISNVGHSTTVADNQGNFTGDIELEPGSNMVVVSAYAPTGDTAIRQIEIVHSTLDPLAPTPSPTPDPDEESNSDTEDADA